MYRERLRGPTVETCRYRENVRGEGDAEAADCGLLKVLLGSVQPSACTVRRDACEACSRSFPPSPESLNPVIASLLYQRTFPVADADPSGGDRGQMEQRAEKARASLEVLYAATPPAAKSEQGGAGPLREILPPPPRRHGRKVRNWAVGVTTAPRRQETLESCLASLVRAGWETPYLFVDSAVRIPERFTTLPGTFRDERIGAWPNYYLALAELLMRHPHADAYMIVQDDVVFYDREPLTDYLAEVLWPGKVPALVSLYCSAADTQGQRGWHCHDGFWTAGPLAFVFPGELAKAFLTDRAVFEHRWLPDPVQATSLTGLVNRWTWGRRLPVWFPTPSLVQHIGEASTLWPRARALGHRRAEPFAGQWPESTPTDGKRGHH